MLLCWHDPLFGSTLVLLCFWSGKGSKNGIASVGTIDVSVDVVLGAQILALEGSA